MIRLILRLLGIRDFEVCQSCETLKQQLEYEREEKKRLTDTLLNILNPKVVESAPVEIAQVTQSAGLFSRRRAALEARDREEAKVIQNSKNIGKPDFAIDKTSDKHPDTMVVDGAIEKLEQELGVADGKVV